MPTRGQPTGVRGGMGQGGTERNGAGLKFMDRTGGGGGGGRNRCARKELLTETKERKREGIAVRHTARRNGSQPANPMHNNREGSSRPRDPPGRGERYLPCSRRRTDGRSRTLRRLSPDARGVGYRRSRPPPPVSPCCRSGTSSTGAVGSTWCPCLLGCSVSGGRRLGPGSPFMCCFLHHATRRRRRATASVGRKATRFLQGVLREGPGSPRLKTWRRAGLAAKAGHCGRMYTKRVMTHGDGKTG